MYPLYVCIVHTEYVEYKGTKCIHIYIYMLYYMYVYVYMYMYMYIIAEAVARLPHKQG